MITIIDWVILYQHATLLVLFNGSQMNSGLCLRPGGLFLCWCATRSVITRGSWLLWAPLKTFLSFFFFSCCCCRDQLSSWVLSPSHSSVMRLNWFFSLTFASSNALNPIRKAYSIWASRTWPRDPLGCYLVWLSQGSGRLILPWSKYCSPSPIPLRLGYYSRLARVIPRWNIGTWGHGIVLGHEN